MDRITHRSSANRATWGNNSLTGSPDSPHRLNLNGDGIKPPVLFSVVRLTVPAGRWPANWARAGFGSNVSTCDGAPFIQRWMMCLALAAKWGRLTASGLFEEELSKAAARTFVAGFPHTAANPNTPIPLKQLLSKARRETKNRYRDEDVVHMCSDPRLPDTPAKRVSARKKHEFITRQQGVCELLPILTCRYSMYC